MSYNPVPTVATGDLWTASNHNTFIRDNFAAGVPDIFTSAGDLAIGSGNNAAARLAIGSSGNILSVSGGLPAWVPSSNVYPAFSGSAGMYLRSTGSMAQWAAPVLIQYIETTTLFQTSSVAWVDAPGLSFDINMPHSGRIIAWASGQARGNGVGVESSIRLMIDGIANPIIMQSKTFHADDFSWKPFTNVYHRIVASGLRNVKLQIASTGNTGNAMLPWANIVAIGYTGA